MSSKERVLKRERERGYADALALQEAAGGMSGTELNAADDRIPRFTAAAAKLNMLERSAGFVCKSSAGRVVKLIQPYDSSIFPAEPEELPAQWGFQWSHDPKKALPFIALSTSPYMIGDCCTEDGVVYRSAVDYNVWAPSDYKSGWTMEEV